MKRFAALLLVVLLFLPSGCASQNQATDGDIMPGKTAYTQISQDTAKEMMARDDGHIVLDVRRRDEFDGGHIPGAICVPNESIEAAPPEELPDPEQVILIYCRSGNRSKQAAQKLADMGYANVYEFGGILDWTGEVTADAPPRAAALSFESFDGGGPEFRVTVGDPSVLSCRRETVYHKEDHALMTGAGYTVSYAFTGLKPGSTTLTVEARSPIADNFDAIYTATVDDALNVSLEQIALLDPFAPPKRPLGLVVEAGENTLYALLEDNASANAFIEQLSRDGITVALEDHGGGEKTGRLPWKLPQSGEAFTAEPGDIVLDEGDRLSICYEENDRDSALLAGFGDITREELLDILGKGDATVSLWLEWPE